MKHGKVLKMPTYRFGASMRIGAEIPRYNLEKLEIRQLYVLSPVRAILPTLHSL